MLTPDERAEIDKEAHQYIYPDIFIAGAEKLAEMRQRGAPFIGVVPDINAVRYAMALTYAIARLDEIDREKVREILQLKEG